MDSTKSKDLAEREAEATGKETLQDFEDSFGDSETGEPVDDDVASPDGAFDEADEHKDAEPM